ncbi:MAG: RidA family protein [Chitinophagaceae bacterium]|nr:RidA family protein [Chitinophagaceae bacterium]
MKGVKKKLSCIVLFLCVYGLAQAQSKPDPEAKLKEMGIVLKTPAKPVANYVGAVTSGKLIFLSGAGPRQSDGSFVQGKVGSAISIEQAQAAAKLTGIVLLEALKAEIGDLKKVKRIVKVLGMVNAIPSFTQQPQVMNGFSDFMVEVFGEKGKHARSAVGVGSLPSDIPVEIEMIVEVY